MLNQEFVSLANILRMQGVNSQNLPRGDKLSLSILLFGHPLTRRGGWATVFEVGEELDSVLRGVVELLRLETGDSSSFQQVKVEWERVIGSDYSYAGIAARRAALLFSLHTLEPVRNHFAKNENALVSDLHKRVLPTTIPRFIGGMAQRPDSLVVMVSALTTMWREDLGSGARE